MAYGGQNPRHFLERLKRTFPHVSRFEGRAPQEITDEGSVLTFLHDNLIKRGCVDDLLCSFAPPPIPEPEPEPEPTPEPAPIAATPEPPAKSGGWRWFGRNGTRQPW
jgi:hypothetical protein